MGFIERLLFKIKICFFFIHVSSHFLLNISVFSLLTQNFEHPLYRLYEREKLAFLNPLILVLMLSVVICSEYIGFYSLNDEGFGFDIFLYYPFDFALLIL